MTQTQRETHVIDATGKVPGRLSTEVVKLLMGKHKTSYEPHIDAGDIVIIENVDYMKVTIKKLDDIIYYSHSGYPGGLKEKRAKEVTREDMFRNTIYNMLPKNKLRARMLKRLKFSN